ncbi:MAG: VWA domain-containing protein [Mariprofundus sp.]|nr:VWA domain-containing protein [Mariprofundus sp.]
MEALNHLHLLRPFCLLLLPLWLLLIYAYWHKQHHESGWSKMCDPALLNYLVGESVKQSRRSPRLALLLGLVGSLLILALAGPVYQQLPQAVYRAQSAMVIVLDLSRSMDAADLKPSRLKRAKQQLQDILKARKEGQTGLVVFAGSAFDVVPLTTDNRAIIALLPSLDTTMMPVQGSLASAGIEHALAMLKRAAVEHGSVVMLTDGVDSESKQLALKLAAAGHQLSVLAVGTEAGAPIAMPDGGFLKDRGGNIVLAKVQSANLAAIATAGKGIYIDIRSGDSDLNHIPGLLPSMRDHKVLSQLQSDQWREEGPWLVLLLLPVVALLFRRGVLLLLLLIPLSMPDSARAMSWQALWQSADQKAQKLMQQGEYDAASKTFHDPAWKSAALYRDRQFAAAAKALEAVDSADSWYNRGNALAKAGKLEPAIAAYDHSLQLQPDHKDAAFNKKIVEQLLKKEQKKRRDKNKSDKKSNSDKSKNSQTGDGKKASSEQKDNKQASGDKKASGAHAAGQKKGDSKPLGQQADKSKSADKQQAQEAAEPQKSGQQQSQSMHNKSAKDKRKPIETPAASDKTSLEQQSARRQWLRRIPDDPGGLLRRKFQYQYQQQGKQAAEGEAW